jgi:hypothetical protein
MLKFLYLEALSWSRSNMNEHTLQGLVVDGQLTGNTVPNRLAWIIPSMRHQEPHPLEGYVVSFTRLHE